MALETPRLAMSPIAFIEATNADSILINSSIALYLNESSSDLDECYQIAEENVYNGKALKKLNQLIEITNK